ncbi:hypothetical protein CCP1ISM_50021 [Azospirillaceae bacterium]
MRYLLILLLLLSGCSIPLKIENVNPRNEPSLMVKCLSAEPFWNSVSPSIEEITTMTYGYEDNWTGLREHLIKSYPNVREEIIIDWLARGEERYKKIYGKTK